MCGIALPKEFEATNKGPNWTLADFFSAKRKKILYGWGIQILKPIRKIIYRLDLRPAFLTKKKRPYFPWNTAWFMKGSFGLWNNHYITGVVFPSPSKTLQQPPGDLPFSLLMLQQWPS